MLTAAGIAIAGAGLLIGDCRPAEAQSLPQKVWTIPSPVVALGYCSLTIGSSTATTLASCSGGVPAAPGGTLGPVFALVEATQPMFYRDDGTSPTASAGSPLASGTNLVLTQNPLSSVRFIASSTTSQMNILFYAVR